MRRGGTPLRASVKPKTAFFFWQTADDGATDSLRTQPTFQQMSYVSPVSVLAL